MPSGLHRAHAVLAVLVVLAAGWAYWMAHPGSSRSAAGQTVTVWDVPPREVTRLAFSDGQARAVLQPTWGEGSEPYVWVEAQSPARQPPPKGQHAPQETPAAPESSAFKGSDAARQLLESFAKLTAERDLGPLDPQEAKKFGLPAENSFVELARAQGEPLRLELGRTSFGGNTRYAHDSAGGHLYLLRTAELRRLAAAQGGLMDRDLLGLKLNEAARLELSTEGRTVTFHKLADGSRWGATSDAKTSVPDVTDFANMLQGLSVLRYEAEGAEEPPTPALEVRVFQRGAAEPAGWMRLFAPQGRTAKARSAHSRRLVEVPAALAQRVLGKARELVRGT